MTIQTIQPSLDIKEVGLSYSSGTNAASLIGDNNNATFIYVASGITYPKAYYIGELANMGAVSATQRVKQLRFRCHIKKHASDPGWFGTINTKFANGFTGQPDKFPDGFYTSDGTNVIERVGPWHTKDPLGREWTKGRVDTTNIHIAWYYSQGSNHVNLEVQEIYVDVDVRDRPTVGTVTVTNNDVSTRPTINWVYTPNVDGDPQKLYQVKVFSAPQVSAPGFNPTTSKAIYDSGQVNGIAEQHQIGRSAVWGTLPKADLSVGVTYTAYVRAAQDFNGSAWFSDWAISSTFQVTPQVPPVPTLTLTQDATVPNLRNILGVTSNLNFLTAQQASLEDGTVNGWVNVANAVLASDATIFADGLRSLKLTPTTGALDVIAATLTATNGARVIGGLTYTGILFERTGVTARTVKARLYWWKKDGTASSILAFSDGTGSTDTTSFAQRTVTATAPADAWFASLAVVITAPAAAEAHYVDKADIHLGSGTTWSRGGFLGVASTTIECAWVTDGENNLAHPQLWTTGDFENGTTNGFFTSGTNSAVAYDKSQQYQGIGSIHWIVKETTSKLYIGWPAGVEVNPAPDYPLAAVPGRVYSFSLRTKCGSGTFSSQLNLQAIDKDGNNVGSVSSQAVTITTSWQEVKVQNFTVPAGAVWVKPYLDNTGAVVDKDVYVSAIQWYLGATVPAVSNLTAQGLPTVWYPVHGADEGDLIPLPGDGTAYVHDFEVPPGWSCVYRARNFSPADDITGLPALSSDSTPYIMTMMSPPGAYVLSLPEDGLRRMQIRVASFDRSQHEEATTFYPLRPSAMPGFTTPRSVVVSDFIGGHDGSLEVVTLTDEEFQALSDLLNLQKTLWLVNADFGAQYIRVGGQGDRQWTVKHIQAPQLNWRRRVTIPFLEVDRPV